MVWLTYTVPGRFLDGKTSCMYIRVIATGHGPGNPVFTILFSQFQEIYKITYVLLFLAACSVLTKIHAYTMTYVRTTGYPCEIM